MNQATGTYFVDVVICIDATGSMSPILNEVKAKAMHLCDLFTEAMDDAGKDIQQLRVKVIAFRDYICDSEPMVVSPFYTLPTQNAELQSFVNRIEALGGGDTPENALEALAAALRSDWTTGGSRRRHAIMMFTDAPALPLQDRADCPSYPAAKMPKNLAELGSWWEGTYQVSSYQPQAGRLVAFVPNAEPWTDLSAWNRYWPTYSQAGKGLEDVDMAAAIDILVGSF